MPSVGAATQNLTAVTATPSAVAFAAAPGQLILADATTGTVTVNLPTTTVYPGAQVAVRKTGTGIQAVIVQTVTGQVNAATAFVMRVPGAAVTLQYDGADWQVLSTGSNPAALIPPGGTPGQVAKKTGAGDYAVGWGAPPASAAGGGGLSPWQSPSRYYMPGFIGANNSMTPTVNLTYWTPMWVPSLCTIASLTCTQAGPGGGATVYLGLYADNPAAVSTGPAARLAGATFTTGTPASYTVAMNYTVTAPSLLWVAFCSSAATTTSAAVTFTAMYPVLNFSIGKNLAGNQTTTALTGSGFTPTTMPADASSTTMTGAAATALLTIATIA